MHLTPADKALAASFAAAICMEPVTRGTHVSYLGPEAGSGVEFVVTIEKGNTLIGITKRFPDVDAAHDFGMDVGNDPLAKVSARVLVETTFAHGRARYPEALNGRASADAREGWAMAADRTYEADKASGAVEARRLARAVDLEDHSPAGVARAQGAFA